MVSMGDYYLDDRAVDKNQRKRIENRANIPFHWGR